MHGLFTTDWILKNVWKLSTHNNITFIYLVSSFNHEIIRLL